MSGTFDNKDLLTWTPLGSGKFGTVFKVETVNMGQYVVIRFMHPLIGNNLEKELEKHASYHKLLCCNFVLPIYGMYEGIPPSETGTKRGMVMEYMKRGSVGNLCKKLSGPPPFPLACRLIHEVALGMNFLHSLGILHRNLKLQNVMLSEELHVRLADFGLCTEFAGNKVETDSADKMKNRPDVKFTQHHCYDICSFGILVWSILSGEVLYPGSLHIEVVERVSQGERPSLEKLSKNNKEGMKDLLDLIEKCWQSVPTNCLSFESCIGITKRVYSQHKRGINKAVYEVLEILKQVHSRTWSRGFSVYGLGNARNNQDKSSDNPNPKISRSTSLPESRSDSKGD